MSELSIPYQSEDFPGSVIRYPLGELETSWSEVLWAALTVGRRSWTDVWKHGFSSGYEAVFRCALVKMALQERNYFGGLYRTDAFENMDSSEKGAINYFLGMMFCKLFSARLLDTHWLLHLDVYSSDLQPELAGGSRPDLVGQQRGAVGRWHSFECKGRTRLVRKTKERAKEQARVLVSVHGGRSREQCDLHVGAITHFRRSMLNFYWRDPEPELHEDRNYIHLSLPRNAWRYYYAPIVDIIQGVAGGDLREGVVESRGRADGLKALIASGDEPVPVGGLDLRVGVHGAVAEYLAANDWEGARQMAEEMRDKFAEIPDVQPDGLIVRTGPSWTERRYYELDSRQ